MYREINAEANTKQLRKAKILQSFRQPPKNKVMLTDLCPEEKAKIGDLVRTLEIRKSENKNLEQKIGQLQIRQKKYLEKIEELERKNAEYESREVSIRQEIALLKLKQKEKDKYIDHLLAQKQQRAKQCSKKQVAYVDQYVLTEPIITMSQSVQCNQKKKKCREKEIQTDLNQAIIQQTKRYSNNSKSFQKIMKRDKVHSQGSSLAKSKKIPNQEEATQSAEEQEIERSFNKRKQNQYEDQDGENDEDFNELARKWLELKEKNMQKIKESYKKSKQKQTSKSKSKSKFQNIGLPRQFNDENVDEGEGEDPNHGPTFNLNIQNNESFGPKKGRKIEPGQDFDEIELNKILKGKNFSASRLLQKHRENSQQSERNSAYDRKPEENLSRRRNRGPEPQNTPNMKMSAVSNSRSQHHIDFYETDLLDIVTSINRS